MCYDETPIKLQTVHRFESEAERDAFALAMQWPEDRATFKRLITPSNITEMGAAFCTPGDTTKY